jgi:uncharacterized protein with HEPN domain
MFDRELALAVAGQIDDALEKIKNRIVDLRSAEDLTATPEGMERMDGLCMLFMAIGEALKNLDKITDGTLLQRYPEVDWRGAMGFRDVIAHQYFDIDPQQVFWICSREVEPLSAAIKSIVRELG